MVRGQYRGLQKFSITPQNTLISIDENKESRIDIDPKYSIGSFCLIYKSLDHHYHLEKEKGSLSVVQNNMIIQCTENPLYYSHSANRP